MQYGIFTIIAPFLLIFSLIYGLIRKARLFGNKSESERIYAVISFAIAMYFVYKVGLVFFTARFISFFFYEMLVLLMILIGLSIFIGFGNSSQNSNLNRIRTVVQGILGLTVVFAFLYAASYDPEGVGVWSQQIVETIFLFLIESGLLAILIIFLILFALIHWMTSTPKQTSLKDRIKKTSEGVVVAAEDLLYKARDKSQSKSGGNLSN